MAQIGRLTTFDNEGETIREREVAFWYVTDTGEEENEDGLYISLSSSADLKESIAETGSGITIRAKDLAQIGYYRLTDMLDEETLLHLGYVKVFE